MKEKYIETMAGGKRGGNSLVTIGLIAEKSNYYVGILI